ncbi:MAG TPA: hypothetical protein VIL20_15340 [Sandaracinaceae bacterium]
MRARELAFLAFVALGPGCIAVPLALPPAKAALGLGAAVGNPLPSPDDGSALSEAEPIIPGRIGITMQAAWPEQDRRPVEVEAGYAFQIFTTELRQNRNRHGAFLGVSVLGGHYWLGEDWRLRIVLRGAGEVFGLQAYPGVGGGGSWGLGLEVARFTSSKNHGEPGRPSLLGYVAGEWSIGAELNGGVYSIGGGEYGIAAFALTLRWPGMAGLVLIPLSGSL